MELIGTGSVFFFKKKEKKKKRARVQSKLELWIPVSESMVAGRVPVLSHECLQMKYRGIDSVSRSSFLPQ